MKFLALVVALLIEQVRPLRRSNSIYRLFDTCAARLRHQLDSGLYAHGALAWAVAVLLPTAAVFGMSVLLHAVSPALEWLWSVAVLYVTMGVRRFSRDFTGILHALQESRLDEARALLARWQERPADSYGADEVARVSIERGLADAHRHVFGTVALFAVLGPAGAVLYRLSALLAAKWPPRSGPEAGEFGAFASTIFLWLDWLPARLTGASFAIVGNFEDAVYCWRTQARTWEVQPEGVVLASGAGALGVRLGDPLTEADGMRFRPELGAGEPADPDFMQGTIGLVWRALLMWLAVLFIITIAHALG